MIGGVSIRKIELVAYDELWPKKYRQEAIKLKKLLGKELIQCFHIGSTAVPGLKAKAVIDILLVVESLKSLDTFSGKFQELGYEVMGEYGIKDRRFYIKGNEKRTHHLHAFQSNNINEIERHLLYRDYLRTHPEACDTYAALKEVLAEKHPFEIAAYSEGKDLLVKEIEQAALHWHWLARK